MFDMLLVLLGINSGSVEAASARFYFDSVCEKVMNYCNIDVIPAGLEYTVVEMAARAYNDGGRSVSSIRDGDTTVTYANTEGSDITAEYASQLNCFRQLRVIR